MLILNTTNLVVVDSSLVTSQFLEIPMLTTPKLLTTNKNARYSNSVCTLDGNQKHQLM